MSRRKQRERLSDKCPILAIILKILVLILLVPYTIGMFPFFFNYALNGGDDFDTADKINMCASSYYERDYATLYKDVHVHQLYGEEFLLYREAAEATLAYENFVQWCRAKENGFPGSDEKIEYYYKEVLDYEKNCKNSENKAVLSEYVKKATQFRTQEDALK